MGSNLAREFLTPACCVVQTAIVCVGCHAPTKVSQVASAVVPHPFLKERRRSTVVPELEQQASPSRVVPGRVAGVEPTGYLDSGQTSLRLAPHAQQRSIQDLDGGVVRVHRPREVEVLLGSVEIARIGTNPAKCGLNTRIVGVERQRFLRKLQGQSHLFVRLELRSGDELHGAVAMYEREARIRSCERGIDGNDLLIECLELPKNFRGEGRAAKSKGSQEQVIRSQVLGWAPPGDISRSSMTRSATLTTMLCAISSCTAKTSASARS